MSQIQPPRTGPVAMPNDPAIPATPSTEQTDTAANAAIPQIRAYRTTWKIGPEWGAQQRKLLTTKTANCGKVTARRTVLSAGGASV